jgi:SCY1-like protein 2
MLICEVRFSSISFLWYLIGCFIGLLMVLITRSSAARPTASSIPSHAFFNALPISTLNFLDRATFAAKPREEKVAFMKGLAGVLSSFSEALKRRKILPSLLEEVSC